MQPNTTKTIERYLDQQLGMWTRLLPWRRELAVHLEEAFEASQTEAAEPGSDDAAWQKVLADFGNVQEVACKLRSEHWPQYLGWRLMAIVAAISVVFSISNPLAFLDLPSLGFALIPVIAVVLFDTFRGSARWAFANRVGTWGCVCGAISGMAFTLTDLNNPSIVGAGMALSLLSALYCMLFFTPRRMVVAVLVGISLVDVVLILFCMQASSVADGKMYSYQLLQSWSVDKGFVMQVLAVLGAGVTAGIARFGIHSIARHAYAVGAGIYLFSLVKMLGDMSDPSKVLGHMLVALGAMGLAITLSHLASDSSRLLLRLQR